MSRLLLIGGGGHCGQVIDVIMEGHGYEDIAIIENNRNNAGHIGPFKIIGTDDDLERLFSEGYTCAHIAVGNIESSEIREKLFYKLERIGFSCQNIISRSALVSGSARLGTGSFINKGAIVNANAAIGDNCILNTGCIIEHDAAIGSFTHIAPGAVVAGGVTVGRGTFIGANAVVIQNLQIGDNCVIGAGSVVLENIGSGKKAFGNPCRCVGSGIVTS